jgi:alpha-tubulin suppressor-like RCC1 family protein
MESRHAVWIIAALSTSGCLWDYRCIYGKGADGHCLGPDAGLDAGPACTSEADCPNASRATARCAAGRCAYTCEPGWGDCDETPGCERPLNTINDCGECDVPCDLANAVASCTSGSCEIDSCTGGYDDCDEDDTTGCEADLAVEEMSCGECGRRCGWQCVAGRCNDAVELGVGWTHTCVRLLSGEVSCWGENEQGQLGIAPGDDVLTPSSVTGITDAVEVAAGYRATCVRRADGTVACWGGGNLGDGTPFASTTPVAVRDIDDAVEIAVGWMHACARRATGSMSCWGSNVSGEIGDGTTDDRLLPTPVSLPTSLASIATGNRHTCAVTAAGRVFCWGENATGELGDGTTMPRGTPMETMAVTGARLIASRIGHSCALLAAGTARCWGFNLYGQLGDRAATASPVTLPVEVQELVGATSITTGFGHSCALVSGGAVVCWGYNEFGQIGDGTTDEQAAPTPVVDLATVIELESGADHTCARLTSGEVRCWGRNASGQVGDGTTMHRNRPTGVRPAD